MLVKDCMTRHPVMVPPNTPITEAQQIMAENNIRHLPVAGDGKRLLGLVTRQRLSLKPDAMASLDVWEITRYLSELKVGDVMLKAPDVITIEPERTIERAAKYMTDHKIGCLPVVEEGIVVGILTEIDVLRTFQEILGLPAEGVRVTVRMPDREGEFAKLTTVLARYRLGIMGVGSYPSPRCPGYYDMVLKIPRVTVIEIEKILGDIPDQEIIDIREVV
ncbi:MAG: CBS domain-containing protein [Chloroflexi bacterium]|nr:MAG: CBS domain-containing protein [Chloroflexota bacterium]